ncbi:MAG TPA: carbon starvation CstA family protein [Vicinamibacterales bacterium]|nr:carbon starvation CstA family protein [Vicinamibacterales bacterium]
MNILFPILAAAAALLLANRLYPRVIARAFDENDAHDPPSARFADGRDYVKSRTHVVFGHHFATIAGAGPIVGPTLAVALGWQPVWLWVVLGGIFFGAVHDMSVMFTSLREGGRSIAEVTRRVLGPAGYVLTLLILIFLGSIANAILLNLTVAALTSVYPIDALDLPRGQTLLPTVVDDGVPKARLGGIATTSVLLITAFAPVLGYLLRRDRISTAAAYVTASAACVASVVAGFAFPVALSADAWRWLMTAYVFAAAALPVWLVLQPRDFSNVQILYGGLGMLLLSALVAGAGGVSFQAPAVDLAAGEAALRGPLWPLLFITVACGAISGIHSLIASGTTVRQLPRESDCRRVGYGAMTLESFLAVLVLAAVGSMLPPAEYFAVVYPESGASNPILGFALGAGRLMHAGFTFLPVAVAVVFGLLMVEGFMVTSLDSSVRLCRYLLEEFWQFAWNGAAPAVLRHPFTNTTLAVALMVAFALSATIRQMWPVFGAGNQLLGALALVTVSVWLAQRARQHVFAIVPALFMIATTFAALVLLVRSNVSAGGNLALGLAAAVLLVFAAAVVGVAASRFARAIQAERAPIAT